MLDKRNLHLKVQEMADCYKGTDFLKEMSLIPSDGDQEEAALKWIALAVLHGVNSNAKKVSLRRTSDGGVSVLAEYRPALLPAPGEEVGRRVIDDLRAIAHFESDKEKGPLAFGLGNDSLELHLKVKRKEGEETVTLEFPE